MSWLEKIQNSRFGRPFRKRQKLGEDEDDWCDALSDLHVDSSSSDEFVDANEQVPVNSSPKGIKRKKTKNKNKNKKHKSREIFGDSSSSSSTADTFTGIEGTSEIHPANPQEKQPAIWSTVKGKKTQRKEKLQKRKSSKMQYPQPQPFTKPRQGSKERSKSTGHDGYKFDPAKKCSDSGYKFRSTPEISSSSSNVDEQMDTQHAQDHRSHHHTPRNKGQFPSRVACKVSSSLSSSTVDKTKKSDKASTSYDKPNVHQQTAMESQMDTGGLTTLTDAKLLEVAKIIGENVDTIHQLGIHLGFSSNQISQYCSRGIKADYSRTEEMLHEWKHKTPEQQHLPGLLAALKKSGLRSLADELEIKKGGLSDSQLGELAQALHRYTGNYGNVRTLGVELGFKLTDVYAYCKYAKEKDHLGLLNMLMAWRGKTLAENQISNLSKALKDANLQHLAHDFHAQKGGPVAPIPQNRKVTVTLMTSSQFYTISGLKTKLETLKKSRPDLIDDVKVLQLPYSRIQYYKFTEDVDIMILCHSIENRRFAITNVTDSLYDEFLDYCTWKFGKEKIVVVAHDFPPEAKEVRNVKMDSFKHTQWSTFEKAGLVMICGMMNKKPEMEEEDWDSLVRFLEAASKSTPIRGNTNPPLTGKKGGKADSNKSKTSNAGTSKFDSVKSLVQSSLPLKKQPIIYICTSSGFSSVKGLQEKLRTLVKRSYSEYEVKEKELPYSRLQDFRFPGEVDVHDAMILCHSVHNRGFSITNVPNSIYDEYLQYCNQVFGKYHLAVIVHDFEDTEEILRIHMDTFRRGQPKTFQLAGFVALARKLDVADVQLSINDLKQLEKFVKNLR